MMQLFLIVGTVSASSMDPICANTLGLVVKLVINAFSEISCVETKAKPIKAVVVTEMINAANMRVTFVLYSVT